MIGTRRAPLLVALAIVTTMAASSLSASGEQTVGLFVNEEGSFEGYTLFATSQYDTTYLIDNDGMLVHSWEWPRRGITPYLLEDGTLIRLVGGGAEHITWDGEFVWNYRSSQGFPHHDLEVLPNGNVLMVMRETHTVEEAIAAGRNPDRLAEGELWSVGVIEVQPTGPNSGEIVWAWRSWDHLVQDYNPGQDNYGVVADHPELIDINYADASAPQAGRDWHHANAVDYNEELDQIVVSVRHFSEIWVIDHSTTTEEASGHSGGNSGKGGDLLYRWGNPQAYDAGGPDDQQFFHQHDSYWIEDGLPGEDNILVFNNGPGRGYSSVDELVPPVDSEGNYALTPGEAYGPAEPFWTYAPQKEDHFYAAFISGARRLPNGNTLIDSGPQGRIFEVTPEGEIVWEYINPVIKTGPLRQGEPIEQSNLVFRAYRYAPDYPGLQGKDLTPAGTVEVKPEPKEPLGDTDGDTVPNDTDLDDDGDGCLDAREDDKSEDSELSGGRRDAHYFWDFYDVWTRPEGDGGAWLRDKVINVLDIIAVSRRFGPAEAPSKEEALVQALTEPIDESSYHTAYDRGPITGDDDWERAPPDGVINIPQDILGVAAQFMHDCA